VNDVDDSVVGERLQVPVDGRQPYRLALGAQLCVDVLCAAETARLDESVLDGAALTGVPVPDRCSHAVKLTGNRSRCQPPNQVARAGTVEVWM
jgi:hypothetical protein